MIDLQREGYLWVLFLRTFQSHTHWILLSWTYCTLNFLRWSITTILSYVAKKSALLMNRRDFCWGIKGCYLDTVLFPPAAFISKRMNETLIFLTLSSATSPVVAIYIKYSYWQDKRLWYIIISHPNNECFILIIHGICKVIGWCSTIRYHEQNDVCRSTRTKEERSTIN